jgi:hypothetical protein
MHIQHHTDHQSTLSGFRMLVLAVTWAFGRVPARMERRIAGCVVSVVYLVLRRCWS